MAPYATLAEARSFGISTAQAEDAPLTNILEVASRSVDDYTGQTFDAAASKTVVVNDVRLHVVVLPTPFRSVTSVTINDGAPLPTSAYVVEPWGLRLYWPGVKDADGFPTRTFTSLPPFRGPYGAKVAVTATFGWTAIPEPVKQATLLVARHLVTLGSYRPVGSVDAEGNATALPDASYTRASADLESTRGTAVITDTTGDVDADRLLRRYRRVQVG